MRALDLLERLLFCEGVTNKKTHFKSHVLGPYNTMGDEIIIIAHFYYVLVSISSEILNICDLITNID